MDPVALLRSPCCAAPMRADVDALVCGACGQHRGRSPWLELAPSTPVRTLRGQELFATPLRALEYSQARGGATGAVPGQRTLVEERTTLLSALALTPHAIVVDVPCGDGVFSAALAAAVPEGHVFALDLAAPMLDIAAARLADLPNVTVLRADAHALPFLDGSVDAIATCGGLHLYVEPSTAIEELRRVLRAGGRVAGSAFRAQPPGEDRAVERRVRHLTGIHAFDFDALGRTFAERGFANWRWEPGWLTGYFSARANL